MSSLVLIVILSSALLHAVWNAIVKGASDKLMEVSMNAAGVGLSCVFLLPFLPLPDPAAWPFIAATLLLNLIYYLFIAFAYRGADLSYAYTIMRGSAPLFTAIVTGFFLGHGLSSGSWGGVLLLSSGILALALDSLRRGNFDGKSTLISLLNAAVIMSYTVVDGTGVRIAGNAISYICWINTLNALPLLFVTLALRGRTYASYVRSRWFFGLAGGFCNSLAYGAAVWCMSKAPIALVASLRETSVIFGVLIGVFVLKERLTTIRALAVLLVACGAAGIKYWG